MLQVQVKKVPPLGGDIELCGCSSCLGGLRSLLNTEGDSDFSIVSAE